MLYETTKPAPYVYICTHKETSQFYIGYRERNVRTNTPSSMDIGVSYFTSSPHVRSTFSEYEFCVVAEFFDATEAYWFEQELIKENWNNPLLLNKQFYDRNTTKGIFRHTGKTSGFTGHHHTEETKRKKSKPHTEETKKKISEKVAGEKHPNFGKQRSEESKLKQSMSMKKYAGENHPCYGRQRPPDVIEKMRLANIGKKDTEETKQKKKEAAKNRPPQSEETRQKRKESLARYYAERMNKD